MREASRLVFVVFSFDVNLTLQACGNQRLMKKNLLQQIFQWVVVGRGWCNIPLLKRHGCSPYPLCMVQFDLLPSPAWQPLGQVQLFGTGDGELFEVVLFLGVEGEANNFSLFLQSTCHFLCSLHAGCRPQGYILLRANAGICGRVVGEE